MTIGQRRLMVGLTWAISLGMVVGFATTAMCDGPKNKELSTKTYNVRRLGRSSQIVPLIAMVERVIEPQSWSTVGGSGTIKANRRNSTLKIQQTAEVHQQLTNLFEALEKLPPLQEKRAKKGTKKTSKKHRTTKPAEQKEEAETKSIMQIPVGKKTSSGQLIMIYYVKDLFDKRSPLAAAARTGHGKSKAKKTKGRKSSRAAVEYGEVLERITSTVAPKTWEGRGGNGVIEVYPKGYAFVVLQSEKVHKELSKMIKNLERLKGKNLLPGAQGGFGGSSQKL